MKRFCFLAFFFTISMFAQETIFSISQSYINYHKYPQEKFHEVFNKSAYFPGEIAYFQTYVFEKKSQELYPETHKANLLVYTAEGKLLKSSYLRFVDGVSSSVIKVPRDYQYPFLYYKIETEWSKNFGETPLKELKVNFGKRIEIPEKNLTFKELKVKPESGSLFYNLLSVVRVKILNVNGFGMPAEGIVKNDLNEEVAYFTTSENGYGKFYLKPKRNRQYYVEVVNDVTKKKYHLPKVQEDGFAFNIIEKSREYYFSFRKNKTVKNYDYLIHANGKIAQAGVVHFNNGEKANFYISKAKLAQGLNTISVFNDNKLIGERSFFNYHPSSEKKVTIVGENIVKDSASIRLYKHSKDSILNITVSVLPFENELASNKNLASDFLMTELKDKILDTDVLIKGEVAEVNKNLLFYEAETKPWSKILNNDSIQIHHLFEKGFSIRGKLKDKTNNSILKNTEVGYFTNTEAGAFKTDENGFFKVSDFDVFEGEKITLQPNSSSKKLKAKLELEESEVLDSLIKIPWYKKEKQKIVKEYTNQPMFVDDDSELLDEVEVKGIIKKKDDDTFVNPFDKTVFVKTFVVTPENVNHYRTVLEYLSIQSGLIVDNTESYVVIFSQRTNSQTILGGNGNGAEPMRIYIDKMPLRHGDVEILKSIYMNQVKSIRVNKSGIGSGGQDPYGSINIYLNDKNIYTKAKSGLKDRDKNVTAITHTFKSGFEREQEYVHPLYAFEPGSKLFNKTATLFWKSNIKLTDELELTIPVPSEIKKYKVIVKGFSDKGDVIDEIVVIDNSAN